MPGPPSRRRTGTHRSAGHRIVAAGGVWNARRPGPALPGTGLSLHYARPRGVPVRKFECLGQSGKPALVSKLGKRRPPMTPIGAQQALDAYFLEARAKIL